MDNDSDSSIEGERLLIYLNKTDDESSKVTRMMNWIRDVFNGSVNTHAFV
jgi:hypothetical protein